MKDAVLAVVALIAIVVGIALHLTDNSAAGNAVWAGATVLILVPLSIDVVRTLLHGNVGVDSIALLAMATGLAMDEYLAAVIVGLMLSGGGALEAWAAGRSRRELKSLLERAPKTAHRKTDGKYVDIGVDEISADAILVVKAGEIIPADGLVTSPAAVIDESALTGEPLPVTMRRGGAVRSGTANAGDAFEFRAIRTPADSAYSLLIRLVSQAEENRAPFVRMADRYAALLLPVTLMLGGAAWAISGESIRFLAVLVVATPCPLILAAPIAFVAGISRSARWGVIVKGGGSIEALGRARSVLFDKTGTLTLGKPEVSAIDTTSDLGHDELLRLTASLDQLSAHVLASALVRSVQATGAELSSPTDVTELPGEGIAGIVDGRHVVAGSLAMLESEGVNGISEGAAGVANRHGSTAARVFVGVDGEFAGALILSDRLRDDSHTLVADLNELGINAIAMITGDDRATALAIAEQAGIRDVRANLTPEDKLLVVQEMHDDPLTSPVVMVGDGVNDAPALALADVGIAIGTAGTTASAEAADAVIIDDRIERVTRAIKIGHRSLHIATQSVVVGIGLSLIAMIFAALGKIPPVAGALLQEGIDVAVILNALRALRD